MKNRRIRAVRPELSVVIVAKNEAANIGACLDSVRWAGEIVVLDSGSTDNTQDLCRRAGCRVLSEPWLGFGPTKKRAVEAASHDWILSVDADERVSETLAEKIRETLESPAFKGYRIRRHSHYLGRRVRFGGWQYDRPLRLFDRRAGNFNDRQVHERVVLNGPVGVLDEPILHHPYPTLESHISKMTRYAFLGAAEIPARRRTGTWLGAFGHGFQKFLKMYVFQLGFLDGWTGLVLAWNSAFGVYLKYLKQWLADR
jgi:glycosyltransferase involved in cell wall biosynthesis